MKTNKISLLNRNIYRYALGTTAILLIPLLGMQVSDDWDWNLFDFAVIGTLLMGTGLTYELLSYLVKKPEHKILLAFGLIIALLLVWAELAVGIFGTPFAGS